jgi:hypothetical protein
VIFIGVAVFTSFLIVEMSEEERLEGVKKATDTYDDLMRLKNEDTVKNHEDKDLEDEE